MQPPSQIAHYKITGELGKGGMGAVYRATDTKLNRDVAIKVLPDSFSGDADRLTRFTREAQVLALLNHPNIAAIYGVEDRAIVLELIEGKTLAGPLSEEEALPLIQQLIDALEYAHEKGIIHRDLKPANIKVTPEGRLKVLDFGLAKALASETALADPASSPTITMRATMAGVIMGTAGYMSPEQARGQAVDKRADIWAFGVVVYELLTGRKLFEGETVSDTLAAVLRHDPDISAVPARFQRLLRLCLMRDPRQRLRDISGARLLLDELDPAAAKTVQPAARRNPWVIVCLALLAAISIAAAGIAWRATRAADRRLMRLSVDLGPDAMNAARTVFMLSPDGSRIVFAARSADQKQVLATRLLDETKVNILPGTEGAADPFFSPDGAWIGFFADTKLKKISVHGGEPIVLAEAGLNPRGASWGEDGNIVMSLNPNTGLSRVPSSGGKVERFTQPAAKGQFTHRWPQFLPGGRAVVFTAHTTSAAFNSAEIDVVDWKTGQWKTVLQGGFFGRYIAGRLVYVHRGSLYAVRFDPDRLEASGPPVPLLEDIAANEVSAAGRFDFAAPRNGSGLFAYMSGRLEGVPATLAWLDKTGKVEPARIDPGGIAGPPRLSPDGGMVAFNSGSIGMENIKVWDARREVLTAITSNSKSNTMPVWAPDGRHLVFSSFVDKHAQLWWARPDGGGDPVKLLERDSLIQPCSFSPDGSRLVFSQSSPESGQDLWTVALDIHDPDHPRAATAELFLRSGTVELNAMFSPDGHWISYVSQEAGPFEVFVRPFPGPGGRWQISSGGGSYTGWSRTGKQLFFTTSDGRIMVADYEVHGDSFLASKPRLWTANRISTNYGAPTFDLAQDGRILASTRSAEKEERTGSVHVTFLLNFFDELKRRLP